MEDDLRWNLNRMVCNMTGMMHDARMAGEDSLSDYLEDCVNLLASGLFAGGRRAGADDLLDLCGRTLDDVAMGDFGEAAGSLVFPVEPGRDHLTLREVATGLRMAGRMVR